MIDSLIKADKSIFLTLNGINNPFFDNVFWIITQSWTWIPLYLALIAWMIYKFKRQSVYVILFAILTVAISDLVSVNLFKEVFCRLRPSHNPEFSGIVHIVNEYRGGLYSFVSSHAANSFAISVFMILVIRKKWFTFAILFWACLFSYSRIYVGVHYPADLTGGALVGITTALLMYLLLKKINLVKAISDRSS